MLTGDTCAIFSFAAMIVKPCSDLKIIETNEQEDFNLSYRFQFKQQESVLQKEAASTLENATNSVASSKNLPNLERLGYCPNYVEYNGNTYHIARFLSLQTTKVYTPMTSRKKRWKSKHVRFL